MGNSLVIAPVFVLTWIILGALLGRLLPSTRFADQSQALTQVAPELEWSTTFGGAQTDKDPLAKQTSVGGYIIAGEEEKKDCQ